MQNKENNFNGGLIVIVIYILLAILLTGSFNY